MKHLNPSQSIRKHCVIFCMNGYSKLVDDCKEHSECVLNKKMGNLKKIKAFCAECALDFKPWECTGIVLNTPETKKYGKCPLHIFRMGKNPKRKGIGNMSPDTRGLKAHRQKTTREFMKSDK